MVHSETSDAETDDNNTAKDEAKPDPQRENGELEPQPVGEDLDYYYEADAKGCQFKRDRMTGKKIGDYGRKAKTGLASKVRKPLEYSQPMWEQAKRRWLKMNEDEPLEFEKAFQPAMACVEGNVRKTLRNFRGGWRVHRRRRPDCAPAEIPDEPEEHWRKCIEAKCGLKDNAWKHGKRMPDK